MCAEFTAAKLVELCRKDGLYRTPEVNDKLYLHYHGFKRIDGEVLGRYVGLRCLWLQGNGLVKLEGLEKLVELRTLCVHENCLEELEGLATLQELRSLNASRNFIRRVSGIERLRELETLILGHNSIGPETACLEGVLELPKLQTLDVQANKLEAGDEVIATAAKISTLRVLYLQGNPCVKTTRHYRKRLVAACCDLRYLDDRPVFDDERRRCEAWARALEATEGDHEAASRAERDEIARIRDEKREREHRRVAEFDEFVRSARAKAEAEQAAKAAEKKKKQSEDPTYVDPFELDD